MALLASIALVNLHIEQTAARPISEGLQSLQSLSMFLAVLAALWGRTLMTLTRWLLLVVLAVGAHGGLRIASSEGVGTGVPLLAALFNRGQHPDPRGVFREAWLVVRNHAEYGIWVSTDWLHNTARAAEASVRTLLEIDGPSHRMRRPPSNEAYLT